MSITAAWIKISAPNFTKRCATATRRWPRDQKWNRKLIRVTSSNERLKHKCVDLSNHCAYFTQFRTEHKWHTINTSEWLNSHNLKIQDGDCRHLGSWISKSVNNSGLVQIYAPNFIGRCITAMRRWPRDQKSKPEVKCVDYSNHCVYFNPIWYRTQMPHYQHIGMA